MPELGRLSPADKVKIRDRTHVLARQLHPRQLLCYCRLLTEFADPSSEFVDAQMSALLHSLRINHEKYNLTEREMDHIFQETQQIESWNREYEEFMQHQEMEKAFDESKTRIYCLICQAVRTQRWVDEFEGRKPIEKEETLQELTRDITQNIRDPKLLNSNFMKLMNKMSTGNSIVYLQTYFS